MYTRYFLSLRDGDFEVIDENPGTVGGYNKIVMEVYGAEVYGKLKFESEPIEFKEFLKQNHWGRVHTSAATVAVMPKFMKRK